MFTYIISFKVLKENLKRLVGIKILSHELKAFSKAFESFSAFEKLRFLQ